MGAIKAKKRQKMCYNCEGEVDLDVIVCPFCAADLRAERPEQVRGAYSPSIHSLKQLGGEKIITPPEEPTNFNLSEEEPVVNEKAPIEEEQPSPSWLKEGVPVALLTLGAGLFLLGLLLVVFSENGHVLLKWDASWWFVYAGLGAVAMWAGYKKIH